MASLKYLYTNRALFPITSKANIKAWGKRFLLLKELYARNAQKNKLIKAGADIHDCAEVGLIKADGNKRNLKIGANSFLGRIELALHDCIEIGENVCINDGVILLTASHDVTDVDWKQKKAPIIIEDFAWICTNAIILPGIRIGRGAVVGAGAIVSKDVQPYDIVAGNPAKSTGKSRPQNLRYNPCEFLAANAAWLKG